MNQNVIDRLKIPYPLKTSYQPVVPQNIFQTWHSKQVPPGMMQAISKIRTQNPGFHHYLFDDHDCRKFIQIHFRPDVLEAYDRLIPGAYKADLWRYCVLFIKGGIYLDIKYMPINGFRFMALCESEHFTLDADGAGIYNALMVCKAGNPILFKAIRQIVENVQQRYYGDGALFPTGPGLLKRFITKEHGWVDLHHYEVNGNANLKFINFNNYPIIKSYHGHIEESHKNSKTQHYTTYWNNRNIYR